METNRLFINKHFLSSILYGDFSAIDSEDERNRVEDFAINKVEDQIINIESQETTFCRCKVTGLYSDCVEITLHSIDKKAV